MDNELPLPPLPRRKSHLSSRFDDRSSQPSSDPALFSSDDVPAGLENYHASLAAGGHADNGRGGGGAVAAAAAGGGGASRKRRYRGTWWGEMVMDPKRKRKDFKDKRFVDSGVWLGSDESFGASSFLGSEDGPSWGDELFKNVRNSTSAAAAAEERHVPSAVPEPNSMMRAQQATVQLRAAFKRVEEKREYQLARAIVNDCLEKGQDSVDLSIGNMKTVPAGLLKPLQHLTKLPPVREPPVAEEVFSSLEPFLRVFLAGNSLVSVPSDLFELDSLKVLSLRNNKLSEIPPAIGRLTSLQEVNLSVNGLRFLPWELLWLIKKGDLKHLVVRSNPLLQINETAISKWHLTPPAQPDGTLRLHEYELPVPEEAWAPIHIATGRIRRFNTDGYRITDPQPIPEEGHKKESAVPSLREVALVSLNRSNFFEITPDSEIADFPDLMLRLLRYARDVKDGGGRRCSICHRDFVLPRTEWIEWWDCSTYENGLKGPRASGEKLRPLPFQRLGCSLKCVPREVDEE